MAIGNVRDYPIDMEGLRNGLLEALVERFELNINELTAEEVHQLKMGIAHGVEQNVNHGLVFLVKSFWYKRNEKNYLYMLSRTFVDGIFVVVYYVTKYGSEEEAAKQLYNDGLGDLVFKATTPKFMIDGVSGGITIAALVILLIVLLGVLAILLLLLILEAIAKGLVDIRPVLRNLEKDSELKDEAEKGTGEGDISAQDLADAAENSGRNSGHEGKAASEDVVDEAADIFAGEDATSYTLNGEKHWRSKDGKKTVRKGYKKGKSSREGRSIREANFEKWEGNQPLTNYHIEIK